MDASFPPSPPSVQRHLLRYEDDASHMIVEPDAVLVLLTDLGSTGTLVVCIVVDPHMLNRRVII